MAVLNGARASFSFLNDNGIIENSTKPLLELKNLDLASSVQGAALYVTILLKDTPQDVTGFCLFHSVPHQSSIRRKFYFAASAADILTPRKVQRLSARLKNFSGRDSLSAHIRDRGVILERYFNDRANSVAAVLQFPNSFSEERVIFMSEGDGVIDIKTGALLFPVPQKPRAGRKKAAAASETDSAVEPH